MLRKFYANSSGVLLIIASLVILGAVQFLDLPIALYPNTSKPEVRIGLGIGSMSGSEFKDRYASDIEAALSAIDGSEKVTGEYRNGNITFWVEFEWGINSQTAKTNVQSVFESWRGRFPREFSNPWYRFEGSGGNRVLAGIKSKKYEPIELEKMIEKGLVPQLQKIDGIENGGVWRLYKRQVLITLNPAQLIQYNLTYEDVLSRLRAKEFDRSLGSLDLKAGGAYQVQADLKNSSFELLRDSIVGYVAKRPVLLREVANVELRTRDLDRVSRGNGERKVLLVGNPKPEANLRSFSEDFLKEVQTFGENIDPDIDIDVLVNPADFINEAVDNVVTSVVIGMIVATLIVFLFLSSFRNTVVVGITIPLSLISGFILMKAWDIGVNLISLGGMALAVGMVVDGSIVMLENISRHLEEFKPQNYEERLSVIMEAVREVRLPILASLLTTIIVFAPLPFTSPLASAILGDLAVVMVCVLSVSIIITLFLLPALVLFLGINPQAGDKSSKVYALSSWFKFLFAKLSNSYFAMVSFFLEKKNARRILLSIVGVCILAGGWVISSQLHREIMGAPDTDKLYLWIQLKEDYTIPVAEEIAGEFEMGIHENFNEYIDFTYSEVSQDSSFILAILKDKRQVKELKKKFEDHFKSTPEARVHVGTWTPTSLRIPNPPIVEASVNSSSEEERRNLLETMREAVRDIDDLGRKRTNPSLSKVDYLTVVPNEEKIRRIQSSEGLFADANFSSDNLMSHISGFLSDREIMKIMSEGEEISVDIRMPKESIKNPDDIGNLLYRTGGAVLPVKALAKVSHRRDYDEYVREGMKDLARIQIWPKESFEGDRAELRESVMAAFKSNEELDLSRVTFEDTEREIDENIGSLVSALSLAVILICIVITLQFGTMLRAAIIMTAIPLGFIGVSFALWIFSSPLNVNSMLGLILLCGTAVNNSIIFLDFYIRIREGKNRTSVKEALMETARVRFRPIMITTLTTILGMMPIAIGYGSGGEILQPLGIAVCGGLGVSTFLTLVVLPVVIQFVEGMRSRFSKKVDTSGAQV